MMASSFGQLVVGGFAGEALPLTFARALAEGRRGGAILFRRNIARDAGRETVDLAAVARLNASIRDATPTDSPPIVAVDQEGGRVARLGAPALFVPSLRTLEHADATFVRRVAHAQGVELAALGFTMNFAPVLDVRVNAGDTVIGDRSFGTDPFRVAVLGAAYAAGLSAGGVDACGKHFPGHGDADVDSHVALPVVRKHRAELDELELVPFRAAARERVAAFMTAHILFPALDERQPATLSHAIATGLLRDEIGFEGVLFSDDLEMGAVRGVASVGETALLAIQAGCDVLLVCSDEAAQEACVEAIDREALKSAWFHHRCEEALARSMRMRRARPPRPVTDRAALDALVGGGRSREVARELEALTGAFGGVR
jgi:beta-N-acetylhexosaminidase